MKKILCTTLCAVILLGAVPPTRAASDFSDVTGHWAIEEIRWARENGVVNGVGNNRFDPEGKVANNAMVKMLVSAFFQEEFNAYEQEYRQVIDIYFRGNPGWDGAINYYALRNGLLDNVSMSIDRPASTGASMTRNDMAMILYNATAKKGLIADESGKSAAKASIKDYDSIPATHREAVTACFALKLLNGDSGSFLGANTMTRAQACTVIYRMANLLGSGTGADPGETPAEMTIKEILVTTKAEVNNSTSYSIADNGFGTGYLNNGKEINMANIAGLLEEAKGIWPIDMTWTDPDSSNNHWYQNPGSIASSMICEGSAAGFDANYASGGFAAMISDYLFGKTANPYHRVTNFSDIRPGDVILQLNADNTVHHAMIVTILHQSGSYLFCAEGNHSSVIKWPKYTGSWNAFGSNELSVYGSYIALSRWPD